MNTFIRSYTETEKKKILASACIICDTREQKNKHITDYFNANGIKHISKKLNFGDYSFMIGASPELGIEQDMYFINEIVIERKNSLEELSSNFTGGRERFNNEFKRAGNCKKILCCEKGGLDDVFNGTFKTQFKANAFIASMLSFQCRYGLDINFISQRNMGKFIAAEFRYYLKQRLEAIELRDLKTVKEYNSLLKRHDKGIRWLMDASVPEIEKDKHISDFKTITHSLGRLLHEIGDYTELEALEGFSTQL